MTATTEQLLAANDMLRAEYPNALIVDATFASEGFRLTVIPHGLQNDSQVGKGATVEDALADLRAKFAAHDPLAKAKAELQAAGYSVISPDAIAQGWRAFDCDECGRKWEWPSRDRFSPSGENCPACGEWIFPHANRADETLPVDSMGNLQVAWNYEPNANVESREKKL